MASPRDLHAASKPDGPAPVTVAGMESTRHDWRPGGETVLGIWAHPDDEAYLSAGLMARAVRAGGRVVCRHATRGERGTADPAAWPPDRLAPHRAAELAASLAVLGVAEHAYLGYRDGECAQVPPVEVVPPLVELMREVRPDYVVTFGPDGITGHPDHIAVCRWVTAAWGAAGCGQLRYAVSTRSFLRRFAAVHARLGLHPDGASAVPDEQVALAVRLADEELDVKRAALAAHASQTGPLAAAMGEQTYRHWYAVEAFRAPTPAELAARS
jgi:LmbE family N-acetylglucosaminyl deacetylase